MIAPDVERPTSPYVAGERETLDGWLELHRATLPHKCAGLTDEQLKRAACPPSNLTLLGLVRHMAGVERYWFRRLFSGEPVGYIYSTEAQSDADFENVANADAEADFATFHAEVEAARRATAGRSLDDRFARQGAERSLRWLYVHVIQEYARHNGHADLLRERVDGATGE